jgi:hypothetical protein
MEQQYIGCDAHRRYSVFVVMDDKGQASKPVRVEHMPGSFPQCTARAERPGMERCHAAPISS